MFFNDVFTTDGGTGWDGYLKVDLVAPNESYTAFDFTELSTTPIQPTAVPEPTSILLLATGAAGLFGKRLRQRRADRQ